MLSILTTFSTATKYEQLNGRTASLSKVSFPNKLIELLISNGTSTIVYRNSKGEIIQIISNTPKGYDLLMRLDDGSWTAFADFQIPLLTDI